MKKTSSSRKRGARLGQHFLRSEQALVHIVQAIDPTPTDIIVEIGPGRGVLTERLVGHAAKVIALEKDPVLVTYLHERFASEIARGQLEIVEGDARSFDTQALALNDLSRFNFQVVGNIPYYISGALIRKFLTDSVQPSSIVFLVQKEVAERIARSAKESLLSLSVKVYGAPRYVRTVKAGSFNPPPSVDSALLSIQNISRKNFETVSEKTFFALLHAGFGQKRKTLRGNLKKTLRGTTDEVEHALRSAFETVALDPTVRAEDVGLHTWLQLAVLLDKFTPRD